MAVYQLGDLTPRLAASAWVADSARVVGDVSLADGASAWFGVVIRGDSDHIEIGRGSNIQDNSVVHADAGFPTTIGEYVTVGHQAMIHGCSIGDHSLVGIQAVILNGAKIGKHCLVGAGALVTEGQSFPDGSLILGTPARVVRQLTPEQMDGLTKTAEHYVENARRYRAGLKEIS